MLLSLAMWLMQRLQDTLVDLDRTNAFRKRPSDLTSPYPIHELQDKGRGEGGACTPRNHRFLLIFLLSNYIWWPKKQILKADTTFPCSNRASAKVKDSKYSYTALSLRTNLRRPGQRNASLCRLHDPTRTLLPVSLRPSDRVLLASFLIH